MLAWYWQFWLAKAMVVAFGWVFLGAMDEV